MRTHHGQPPSEYHEAALLAASPHPRGLGSLGVASEGERDAEDEWTNWVNPQVKPMPLVHQPRICVGSSATSCTLLAMQVTLSNAKKSAPRESSPVKPRALERPHVCKSRDAPPSLVNLASP